MGYKAIHETFTSRVDAGPARLKILVEYIDGPFRHLENRWSFRRGGGGCAVEFFITYEFRSRTLGLLMGAMFDAAFRRFAEAFEERANVRLWPSSPRPRDRAGWLVQPAACRTDVDA